MTNFIGQEIKTGKTYVYLKNERTGSGTIRKLKMIGKCIETGKRITLERLSYEGGGYFDKYGESRETIIDKLNDPEDVICEVQTADDVATVIHADWMIDEFGRYCSACEEYIPDDFTSSEYCPNCGAKMDLQDD